MMNVSVEIYQSMKIFGDKILKTDQKNIDIICNRDIANISHRKDGRNHLFLLLKTAIFTWKSMWNYHNIVD